jgi:Clp amino terminal domain, pathogenicity island component
LPAPQHRICQLADEAAAITKPLVALERLRELRDELVAFERARVVQALRTGGSFGAVAKAMGISRQAAHRRYCDLAPAGAGSKHLSLSSQSRHAIRLAREEAAAAGERDLSSDHLLLGVLRSGGATSTALEAGGVTTAAARKCIRADAGKRSTNGTTGSAARAVFAEAEEIARARHSSCVDADHLALAALNSADGKACQAITALGVTPASVRERLGC